MTPRVVATTAPDSNVTGALLHGGEREDFGYKGNGTGKRNLPTSDAGFRLPQWFPHKHTGSSELALWKLRINRRLSSIHARDGRRFQKMERRVAFSKVRRQLLAV